MLLDMQVWSLEGKTGLQICKAVNGMREFKLLEMEEIT